MAPIGETGMLPDEVNAARKARIVIRRLAEGDAAVLAQVADEVFDEPIEPARLSAYLSEPGHILLLACAGERVVGQCAAVIHRHPDKPTELYVDEVGVSPAWQRQGIARRLLEAMLTMGREAGCEEAWVGTETDNKPARALYEQHGAEAEPFVMYVYDLRTGQRPAASVAPAQQPPDE